jgi:hypothetical protein
MLVTDDHVAYLFLPPFPSPPANVFTLDDPAPARTQSTGNDGAVQWRRTASGCGWPLAKCRVATEDLVALLSPGSTASSPSLPGPDPFAAPTGLLPELTGAVAMAAFRAREDAPDMAGSAPIDWTHILWSDDLLPPITHRALYDDPPCKPINRGQFRADLLRYDILYEHGGVYVDMDFEALTPIDDLLAPDLFATWEFQNRQIANGLMGATSGHPFIKRLIDTIPRSVRTSPASARHG